MTVKHLAIASAIVAGLALPAAAEPYVLDKSHAQISFQVDHLGFSTVRGHFREFDAQIDFDPEAVEETQLRFVIDPTSIDTFWEKRDEHLQSEDFFDVANHPEIVFESTEVRPTGGETATVIGNLTMRGVTREVAFEAELNKLGPSPFEPTKTVAGFSATGEINRVDFGMDYGAPAVSAVVPVRIDLEMSPAQ